MKKVFMHTLFVSVLFLCVSLTAHAKIDGIVGTFTDTSSTFNVPTYDEKITYGEVTNQAKAVHLDANKTNYGLVGIQEDEAVITDGTKDAYCSEKYLVIEMDIAIKSGGGRILFVPEQNVKFVSNWIETATKMQPEQWYHIRAVVQPGTRYGAGGNTSTYAQATWYLNDELIGTGAQAVRTDMDGALLYVEKQYKFRIAAGEDGMDFHFANFKVWATNDEVDGTTATPIPPEPEPDPDPDPDPEPADGEEVIYAFEFDRNGDLEGWNNSGSCTWSVSDGTAKIEYNGAERWSEKKVDYEGGEIYKMVIRARITGAVKPTDVASPRATIYYSGTGADGGSLPMAEARTANFSWDSTMNENGTFDSDWAEYEVDLSGMSGFASAKNISALRIRWIKNSNTGKVEVDYIRLYSLPGISKVTYNGGKDIADGIPCKPDSIEVELTQPIYSVSENGVKILDEDGGEIQLSEVSYDSENKRIVLKPKEEMFSSMKYTIILTREIKVAQAQTLYKEVKTGFKTQSAVIDFEEKSNEENKPVISVKNDSGEADNIYLAATYWLNNKYIKKTIIPITFTSGSDDFEIDCTGEEYNRAEISLLRLTDGRIVSIGSRVFKYEK